MLYDNINKVTVVTRSDTESIGDFGNVNESFRVRKRYVVYTIDDVHVSPILELNGENVSIIATNDDGKIVHMDLDKEFITRVYEEDVTSTDITTSILQGVC